MFLRLLAIFKEGNCACMVGAGPLGGYFCTVGPVGDAVIVVVMVANTELLL